jgi:hypothetical protein
MAAEWLKKLIGSYPTGGSDVGVRSKNNPYKKLRSGIFISVEIEQWPLAQLSLSISHDAELAQAWLAPSAGP